MRKLYILIPVLYFFFHLTSFAMSDLFGMGSNIFAFIILMAVIMGLDIAADHFFHHKLQFFIISRKDRVYLTIYAAAVWIGMEAFLVALNMIIYDGYTIGDYFYYMLNPGLLIGAGMMSIAVWFSLGYVLPEKEAKNDLPDEQIYLKTRRTSIDIAAQIKQEKEKIKDEYKE